MSPKSQPAPPGAFELTRLPDRLRQVARPYSVRELAHLTRHHPERVRRYLRGETPSVSFLLAICEVLGLSADWLLRGQGQMHSADREPEAMLLNAPLNDLLDALAWRWLRQPCPDGLSSLRNAIAALDRKLPPSDRQSPLAVRSGDSDRRNGASRNGSPPRRR